MCYIVVKYVEYTCSHRYATYRQTVSVFWPFIILRWFMNIGYNNTGRLWKGGLQIQSLPSRRTPLVYEDLYPKESLIIILVKFLLV
jgi:hypothetical protein